MRIISHRGNLNGPCPEYENTVESIQKAISLMFDVEVDLWVIKEEEKYPVPPCTSYTHNSVPKYEKLYLGHDKPEHEIDAKFLESVKNSLWIHAKNKEALEFLSKTDLHYFFHNTDKYTLTSKGYIWTFKGEELVNNKEKTICVLPDFPINTNKVYGICTDYPILVLTQTNTAFVQTNTN